MSFLLKNPSKVVRFSDAGSTQKPEGLDSSTRKSPFAKQQSTKGNAVQTQTSSREDVHTELDRKHRGLNYFHLAADLRSQCPIRRNVCRFKSYPDTLVGLDILNWLIQWHYALDITEANYLATQLIVHGHIYDVLNEEAEIFRHASLYKLAVTDRREFDVDQVDLAQAAKLLELSLKKRDLDTTQFTFQNVFSGYDAVSLIIQKGLVLKRVDAQWIGAKMLDAGQMVIVESSSKRREFLDDANSFYILKTQMRVVRKAKTCSEDFVGVSEMSTVLAELVGTSACSFGSKDNGNIDGDERHVTSLSLSNGNHVEFQKQGDAPVSPLGSCALRGERSEPRKDLYLYNDLEKSCEFDSIDNNRAVRKPKRLGDDGISRDKSLKSSLLLKARSMSSARTHSRSDSNTTLRDFMNSTLSRDSSTLSSDIFENESSRSFSYVPPRC